MKHSFLIPLFGALFGMTAPLPGHGSSFPAASFVLEEPIGITVTGNNGRSYSLFGHQSYSDCSVWHYFPLYFEVDPAYHPTYQSKTFNLQPLDNFVTGMVGEYGFSLKPVFPSNEMLRELRATIASRRAINPEDVQLQVMNSEFISTELKMFESARNDKSLPLGIEFLSRSHGQDQNCESTKYNINNNVVATLRTDLFNPQIEPEFGNRLNSGADKAPLLGQPPVIKLGYNTMNLDYEGNIDVQGTVGPLFYSYLANPQCSTQQRQGPQMTDCPAPQWINQIRECEKSSTLDDCRISIDQLRIHFRLSNLHGGQTVVQCIDEKCEEKIEVSKREYVRFQLLNIFLKALNGSEFNASKNVILTPDSGKGGIVYRRFRNSYRIRQSTAKIMIQEIPVHFDSLMDQMPLGLRDQALRSEVIQCMRNRITETPELYPLDGIYYPLDRNACGSY